jgi:hypothetical protein
LLGHNYYALFAFIANRLEKWLFSVYTINTMKAHS